MMTLVINFVISVYLEAGKTYFVKIQSNDYYLDTFPVYTRFDD